jgi:radical SAM superfamily enzyme YgiQ (UPF0313 family)
LVSATIAAGLDPDIKVMLGGHQARAMPARILADPRMSRCEALILGEAETRAARLLDDHRHRDRLPGIMWADLATGQAAASHGKGVDWLAPDINALPFVDRAYLVRDPHPEKGRMQANMVGARGCPYNCSFCGAAISANPDITIRVRTPDSILAEMHQLREEGVAAFRFVDDLFLGARRVTDLMMAAFTVAGVGDWAKWDATGRINVLNRLDDKELDRRPLLGCGRSRSALSPAYATSIRLSAIEGFSPLKTSIAFLFLNGMALILLPLTARLIEAYNPK